MIWYFLAGFIAGAVGMSMFAKWANDHLLEGCNDEKEDKSDTD